MLKQDNGLKLTAGSELCPKSVPCCGIPPKGKILPMIPEKAIIVEGACKEMQKINLHEKGSP